MRGGKIARSALSLPASESCGGALAAMCCVRGLGRSGVECVPGHVSRRAKDARGRARGTLPAPPRSHLGSHILYKRRPVPILAVPGVGGWAQAKQDRNGGARGRGAGWRLRGERDDERKKVERRGAHNLLPRPGVPRGVLPCVPGPPCYWTLGEQFAWQFVASGTGVPKPLWVKTLGWQELEGRGYAARRLLL